MNQDHPDNQPEQQELQVHIPPEIQGGQYANQTLISHTQEEFVLDFILATPPAAIVNARVLVSPTHAKRMIAALQDNIARYESIFGEIKTIAPMGKPDGIQIN